jgi:hypothetical protein
MGEATPFILLRLPGRGAQSGLALGAPLYRQKLLGEEKGPRCSHAPAFSHTQIHPLCTGCSRLHPYALRPRTCYRGRISDSNEDGTAAAMQRCREVAEVRAREAGATSLLPHLAITMTPRLGVLRPSAYLPTPSLLVAHQPPPISTVLQAARAFRW